MRLSIVSLGLLALLGPPIQVEARTPDLCQSLMTLAAAATAEQRTITIRVISGWDEKTCHHKAASERRFCGDALQQIGMEFRDNYPTGLAGCLSRNGRLDAARRDGGPTGKLEQIEVEPYRFEDRPIERLTLVSGDLASGERLTMTVTPVDPGHDAFDLEVRPAPKQGVAPGPPRR